MDAAEVARYLDSFLIARWGNAVLQRPRASRNARPWGDAAEPESYKGMSWTVFADVGQPLAVGIREIGVKGNAPLFLLVYWWRDAKGIASHHWRCDPVSGWQHVAELASRS